MAMKRSIAPSQKMKGSMVMTPQLQKKLSLLTISTRDLVHEISLELENNPALEIISERNQESLDSLEEKKHYTESKKQQFELIEQLLSVPETLSNHLIWQLRMENITEREFSIGELLIENLDENGFFLESPYTCCQSSMKVEAQEIEHIVSLIQRFEPEGCATSGVLESLHVQVSYLDIQESQKTAIQDCLDHLETLLHTPTHDVESQVEQYLQTTLTDEEAKQHLHHLVPYPGRKYVKNTIDKEVYVIPDAIVTTQGDELIIKTNDDIIPVLSITDTMIDAKHSKNKEEQQFAEQWTSLAESFIQGLEYRKSVLEKVLVYLVEYHKEYFRGNTEYLAQLTRKQVAEDLTLHESTISRIVSHKYIQSDQGTFPLRYFFSKGVGDSATNSHKIIHEITQILKELKHKGQKTSDRIIAELLQEKGINIARRTVSKYRALIKEYL